MLKKIRHMVFLIFVANVAIGQKDSVFYKRPILGDPAFAEIKPDSIISSVLITDCFVGRVSHFDLKNIPNNGRVIGEIQLKYYENDFILFCGTRGFHLGNTLTFPWRLEGLHNDWEIRPSYTYGNVQGQQLQNGQQIQEIVQYHNLTPGKYVFNARVKISYEDWRKNEARSMLLISNNNPCD